MRKAIAPVQQGNQGHHTRAEATRRQVRGALRRHEIAAARTADRMELILGDNGLDLRQVELLLTKRHANRA